MSYISDKINKICITGGNGFIGSAFARRVLALKKEVLNIDAGFEGSVPVQNRTWESYGNYKLIEQDINKLDLSIKLLSFKPDLIIHFAAQSHVDESIANPQMTYDNNLTATINLLEATRSLYGNGLRPLFIYVSTDEVFGSLGSSGQFNENSQILPRSPYSASKAAGEHAVYAWHSTYDIAYLITNCSNNFGEYQHKSKLIPKLINSLYLDETFPIYGTGLNVREWLYVEDHVDAIIHLINKGNVNDRYGIGSDVELSNIDIISKIIEFHNEKNNLNLCVNDVVKFVPDRPGHDFRYSIDCSKIRATGWKPTEDFVSALRKTYDWFANFYER